MKAVRNFLSYIEISTKIASVLPFLIGTGYALYRYGFLHFRQTIVFFIAMLLFDMTTTALNNHVGDRQTGRDPHYRNAVSMAIILLMGLSAMALGLYLVFISDIVVLLAGIFCFGIGIVYNCGFLPLARTPFGELVSGTVMGICIPLIALQINRPIISIGHQGFSRIILSLDWVEAAALGVVVMPLICCISNIMLANNICDMQEDAMVRRYTLPFYIGVEKSLLLYRLLYITAYGFIVIASLLRIVPLFTLVTLLTLIPVKKNIRRFLELQDKRQTFIMAIANFLLIAVPYAACIWIGCLPYLL